MSARQQMWERASEELRAAPTADVVVGAVVAVNREQRALVELLVDELIIRMQAGRGGFAAVNDALVASAFDAVADRWEGGWQPADLAHVVGRRWKREHQRIAGDVIALQAEGYRHLEGADPSWLAQVDAVGRRTVALHRADALSRWVFELGGAEPAITAVVEVLAALRLQPPLPKLVPPPSEWSATSRLQAAVGRCDPRVAAKIRALLAKAESTTFPPEAEAFVTKAQELMSRYSVDQALLADQAHTRQEVVGRRILLDDPYVAAKSLLVAVVAGANGCSAVSNEGLGFATVFGAPTDLDLVELLHTSLLTQATSFLVMAGKEAGARARSRGFRSSFLVSFASRIGERLEEAREHVVEEAAAEHGDRLLPVLAARDEAVEEAVTEAYPHLRRKRYRAGDRAGWEAGRDAADRARLSAAAGTLPS